MRVGGLLHFSSAVLCLQNISLCCVRINICLLGFMVVSHVLYLTSCILYGCSVVSEAGYRYILVHYLFRFHASRFLESVVPLSRKHIVADALVKFNENNLFCDNFYKMTPDLKNFPK